VYDSDSEFANSLKILVEKKLNEGLDEKQIYAYLKNKYGDWLDSNSSEKILIGEIENNNTKKQEIFNQEKINFLDGIEFQNIDVWFPLLHGFNGEDGSIHGLIRFTKKPLIGCGIIGSALGMDKILMKTIFSNLKLPQVNYLVFQNENLNDKLVKNKIINEIIKNLKFLILNLFLPILLLLK